MTAHNGDRLNSGADSSQQPLGKSRDDVQVTVHDFPDVVLNAGAQGQQPNGARGYNAFLGLSS